MGAENPLPKQPCAAPQGRAVREGQRIRIWTHGKTVRTGTAPSDRIHIGSLCPYCDPDCSCPCSHLTYMFEFRLKPCVVYHFAGKKSTKSQKDPIYLLCRYKPICQTLRQFDGTPSIGKGARRISTLPLSENCASLLPFCLISCILQNLSSKRPRSAQRKRLRFRRSLLIVG